MKYNKKFLHLPFSLNALTCQTSRPILTHGGSNDANEEKRKKDEK